MKKKKYLAIFMAMSMVVTAAPVTALADGTDAPVDGIEEVTPNADGEEGTTFSTNGVSVQAETSNKATPIQEETKVAEVNNVKYATLAKAIEAAESGQTVTLLEDTNVASLLSINKNITLDLGGKKLSRNGSVLDLYADVTIQNGTVETTEKGTGAVWVNQTAKLTVAENATITATENDSFAIGFWKDCTAAEVDFKGKITGGNGITMNGLIQSTDTQNKLLVDGAKIEVSGHGIYQAGYSETAFSIEDSVISGSTGIEVRAGKLNVTNSTISGEGTFSCVANGGGSTTDGAGIAIVQHTTKLPIEVKISGGTISGSYAIYEKNAQGNSAEDIAKVKLAIEGGNFDGPIYSENLTGFISGGYFSSKPAGDYVADGMAVLPNSETGYPCKVGQKTEDVIEVVDSVTSAKVDENIAQENKTAAEEVASAAANATVESKDNNQIDKLVAEVANANTLTKDSDEVKKAATTLGNSVTVNELEIVASPYIDIEVKNVATDETTSKKTITLDIKAMCATIATTDKDDIHLNGDDKNAVVLETKELNVTQPVTITLPLPADFATAGTKLNVKHVKENGNTYIYEGTVSTVEGTTNLVLTFTNPNGFSTFEVGSVTEAVAKIGNVGYISLQDAVDAVKNGETINVTKAETDLTATVSGNKTFTVTKADGVTGDVTLTAAGGYRLSQKEAANGGVEYTVSKRSSSSSSSGGGSSAATTNKITINKAENGTIEATPAKANTGDKVVLTPKANEGYTPDKITVKDKDGKEVTLTAEKDGTYSFTMPKGGVTVDTTFKQAEGTDKPAAADTKTIKLQIGNKIVTVDGKAIANDVAPVIRNDRTLVPIRVITEVLGGQVAWNEATKEVTLTIDGKEIKMTIGKTLEKYGVAPVIIGDRTFVPVRFVADELGATVAWDDATKTVTITTTK